MLYSNAGFKNRMRSVRLSAVPVQYLFFYYAHTQQQHATTTARTTTTITHLNYGTQPVVTVTVTTARVKNETIKSSNNNNNNKQRKKSELFVLYTRPFPTRERSRIDNTSIARRSAPSSSSSCCQTMTKCLRARARREARRALLSITVES
jgi:hypothetical protein